jgi:prepilin-type N-terminal cleavage/methylation domain-containing protein
MRRITMARFRAGENRGFSLIEVMVSMVVLLVIMSSVFYIMSKYQRIYQTEQVSANMLSGANSTLELLSQEIGQAGYLGFTSRGLTPAVTGGTAAQWVAISDMAGNTAVADLFVGEKLLVDTGANEELVTLTGVNATSVQGVFTQSHAPQAPVNTLGTFPDGILPTSTATRLQLFGDINGDGTLMYVEYNCNTAAGTVTRSITPIGAAQQSAAQVLLSSLQANADGTACFQYRPQAIQGWATPTVVTQVLVTLTARSASPDVETKKYRTVTSSLIASPRNVGLALDLAAHNTPGRLQPKPTNLPLSPGVVMTGSPSS